MHFLDVDEESARQAEPRQSLKPRVDPRVHPIASSTIRAVHSASLYLLCKAASNVVFHAKLEVPRVHRDDTEQL